MAEANVSNAPKKRRSTAERGIQFSLNVELPRNQESRLLGMKDRIKMAKSCLNLSKATSSTQNADLLEALLLAFEEKVQRSKETSCVTLVPFCQINFRLPHGHQVHQKVRSRFQDPLLLLLQDRERLSLLMIPHHSHHSHRPSQRPSRRLQFFELKNFRFRHRQQKMTLSTSLLKEPYVLCFRFLQPSSRRSAVFVVRSMMKIPYCSKGRVMQCL